MKSHRRIRRASECFATWLLEELGFNVLDVNKPLVVDGVEVSDIDVLAEKEGIVYAVEVKGGAADVSSVRQAYTNALLAQAKPLVIARGVDDKARKVAERLGVDIIVLPDMLYCGYEDLREAVREALYSFLDELLDYVFSCDKKSENTIRVLRALSEAATIKEFAEKIGLSVEEAGRLLGKLYREGVLPRGSFRRIKIIARLKLLYCSKVDSR